MELACICRRTHTGRRYSNSVAIAGRDRWFGSTSLQQTVRLSLDFSFLYRKAGSCRGVCAGPARRHGRQRRTGLVNITPTAGNISVGPYSSTAVRLGGSQPGCTGAKRGRVSDVTKL
jgi:hypothetical protein